MNTPSNTDDNDDDAHAAATTTTASTTSTTSTTATTTKVDMTDAYTRPSIKIYMIRHAESRNNEVYRDARYIYGTDSGGKGWEQYVNTHRTADPTLSQLGRQQSDILSHYLVPHLIHNTTTTTTSGTGTTTDSAATQQSCHSNNLPPINIITSPMQRTCDTIRPTLLGLLRHYQEQEQGQERQESPPKEHMKETKVKVIVNGFYFESEGCHTNEIPESGMNPTQIKQVLLQQQQHSSAVSSSSKCPNDNNKVTSATTTTTTTTTTTATAATTNAATSTTSSTTEQNHSTVAINENFLEMEFVGFPNVPMSNHNNNHNPNGATTTTDGGWYSYGTGPETRTESEQRAAKFYCWFCDYLDELMYTNNNNSSNSNSQESENTASTNENENEKGTTNTDEEDDGTKHSSVPPSTSPKRRPAQKRPQRQIQLLIGHGDFMSLVLKRIVSGFGHAVETIGMTHRSAFVHWNTGITELEYFGHGRFLIMAQNTTPHFSNNSNNTNTITGNTIDQNSFLSGGSLKDGWSYLMPNVQSLNAEVSVAFSDDELDDHVLEQRDALKALYLSSNVSETLLSSLNINNNNGKNVNDLTVEEEKEDIVNRDPNENSIKADKESYTKHFIVKRGLQVVGVASYSERTGHVYDVAVRPSTGIDVAQVLFNAVKDHSKTIGRSGSLLVFPRTEESKRLFESVGFTEVNCNSDNNNNSNNSGIDTEYSEYMELTHD